uniref:Uncharacterized protein n=1 Tax=Prorocentrum micans TaxID=2945 RepID=A0A7S2X3L3_PROMC
MASDPYVTAWQGFFFFFFFSRRVELKWPLTIQAFTIASLEVGFAVTTCAAQASQHQLSPVGNWKLFDNLSSSSGICERHRIALRGLLYAVFSHLSTMRSNVIPPRMHA